MHTLSFSLSRHGEEKHRDLKSLPYVLRCSKTLLNDSQGVEAEHLLAGLDRTVDTISRGTAIRLSTLADVKVF